MHLSTPKTWRGGEQQVLYLAKYLQSVGIHQIVACRTDSEMQKRCESDSIPFAAMPMRSELDIGTIRKIIRTVKENQINILHAHTAKAHSIGLLAMKWGGLSKLGVRFVVTRRVDFKIRPGFLSRMKYQSKAVDRYIAISENVRQILIGDGIADSRIRIAYSGIDTNRLATLPDASSLRQEFNITNDTVVFGNVAALVDHKDQETLVKAVGLLKDKELPRFIVMIVGEGELRSKLESLVQSLNIADKVIFTGFRNDIPSFYSLFDIFVLSSKEEGLGTSVLDAMSAGLPVIATRGGGIPEMIVPEQGGLLSDVKDAEGLALNLAFALQNQSLWPKWAKFNKDKVGQFDYHETGRCNLEIYSELLNS